MSENTLYLSELQSSDTDMKLDFYGIKGNISQIPGLSPTISPSEEERVRGRRVGILHSDSDYVKLAKQGGHKGLLRHEETITPKAAAYKPPNWFIPASEDNDKPSLITGEEKKNPVVPFQAPFGTDNMSIWERSDSCTDGKDKKNNVHYSQMENQQWPQQQLQTSRFKRIVFDKKPLPVDMSKLLSFGYVEDDKPDNRTDNADLSNLKTEC